MKSNFNLLEFNTFGLNVRTKYFAEYHDANDLQTIFSNISGPFMVIGRGSNILFTSDYDGTILHSNNTDISVIEDNDDYVIVSVGAGKIWDEFVEEAINRGWNGIENLSLIPGEVGASSVQNIGAYGVEAKDSIEWVEYFHIPTKSVMRKYNKELKYSYRSSIFKNELKGEFAILNVAYRLSKSFVPKIEYGALAKELTNYSSANISAKDIRSIIINIRNSKLPDPKVIGSAGSFFMNPIVSQSTFDKIQEKYPNVPFYKVENGVKIPAGWMIEQCGWKGKALGNAGVYEKQALVLINRGGAEGKEIVELSKQIQQDVFSKFGLQIYPEVIMV